MRNLLSGRLSLSGDDTHFLGGVGHKKIVEVVKPSPVIRSIDNRWHAVVNLSDQIVCVSTN
jgi:hypothetical protein